MMKSPNKSQGFTLLEILIAMFVFSILALVLSGALRSVIQSQAGTEKSAERLREVQFALLLLSRDIEQAVSRSVLNTSGKEEAAFIGESKAFTLTHAGFANPMGSVLKSNLQRSTYSVAEGSLWRSSWEALDQAPTSKPHLRLLLTNVSEVQFQYLAKGGQFHPVWPPSKEMKAPLPAAIRVQLTLSDWGTLNQLYVITSEQSKIEAKTSSSHKP